MDVQASPRKRKRNENTIGEKSKPYFELIGEEVINGVKKIFYTCKICKVRLNGVKEYNLGSHLQHSHSDIYFHSIVPNKKDPIPVKRLKLLLRLFPSTEDRSDGFWILAIKII